MRNLSQYPITTEEMIAALEWAVLADFLDWEKQGRPIGDLRGVALVEIKERLKTIKEWQDAGKQDEK